MTAFGISIFGGDELKKYCVKHLTSLESDRLAKLINGEEDYTNPQWLHFLLMVADQSLFDIIFDVLKSSNALLRDVAYSEELI